MRNIITKDIFEEKGRIGKGRVINTCSSVDHNCEIGDFAHIAVGSHLCGTVSVGSGTWIGVGATVTNNVNICGDCMIGAGAVVIHNIAQPGTYIGVPAEEKHMKKFVGGGVYLPIKTYCLSRTKSA